MNSLKITEADLYTRGNNNLRCASNTRMKVIGTMQTKLKINQFETKENIISCENYPEILISWHACKRLAIISYVFTQQLSYAIISILFGARHEVTI